MINPLYIKALYNLAKAKRIETGVNRSTFVQSAKAIEETIQHPLYFLIWNTENIRLTNIEVLPHIIGDETERLTQKCLTDYWAWKVLQEACIIGENTPITHALNEMRSHIKPIYREKLNIPVSQMKQELISELTAYGILLWDGSNNQIVPNPIFF
jgi:hypothetical protein